MKELAGVPQQETPSILSWDSLVNPCRHGECTCVTWLRPAAQELLSCDLTQNHPLRSISGLSLAVDSDRREQRAHLRLLAMMQISESYNQKNSLFNAMTRFIGAVNNMDQTVMVPSLLRDVPLDDTEDVKAVRTTSSTNGPAYFHRDADMYGSYMLLKSIRNDIEWGVLQGEERRKERVGVTEEHDLEKEFHFHLNGLHTVLSKLTRKADTLTSRYKQEIGCRN